MANAGMLFITSIFFCHHFLHFSIFFLGNVCSFEMSRIVDTLYQSTTALEDHYEATCFSLAIHLTIIICTITTEIHARSLTTFYCQYADRHINLKFMRRVSERERAIRQFAIIKNKLMSLFSASVLLLTMNFVITLPK